MTKTIAETRFEKARKRLSEALKNIEAVIKDKISEVDFQARIVDADDNYETAAEAVIAEQKATIKHLNSEINRLQKSMAEVGSEVEFLNEKNHILSKRKDDFVKQKNYLIHLIENDLQEIRKLINGE